MLNLDETLSLNANYVLQKDLYLKGLLYSIGVIIFIEIVRSQVAEVNLLQLIPGFYLIVLFISFILLLNISSIFVRIGAFADTKKELGTKTKTRVEFLNRLRLSLFFLSIVLLIVLNSVIPLSLDSFNSYGGKNLENVWSFYEVISLEILLLTILVIISQFPIIPIGNLTTEKDINYLPKFWKSLSFGVILASAVLTPTIDGYTQISFAGSTILLYFLTIQIISIRINLKLNGNSLINS